jgi:hypothetical protein
MYADAETRFEAWQVTLDRIELDVIRTERALEDGEGFTRPLDPWHVPENYGPLPASLRPRAEELVARQQDVMGRLATRLGTTAQHQAVVAGVDRVTPGTARGPVYIDVSA